jgi:hypothetical protein
MRHSSVEDLVLHNHALLAEAEEARARWLEVWNASLIVQIGWLLSPTSYPPPISPRPASRARYAHYERIADAASGMVGPSGARQQAERLRRLARVITDEAAHQALIEWQKRARAAEMPDLSPATAK